MKRKTAHGWLLLGAALLLIAAVFYSGVFSVQKTWTSLDLDFRDGKSAFSLDAGDSYGVVASGPYFDLPAGEYRIKWRIEGDGENLLHLTGSNGVSASPQTFKTTAGGWEGEACFTLPDTAHFFRIDVEFASGTFIRVNNFRLYSPEYTDGAWTFAFLVLFAWLLYMLNLCGVLTARRRQTLMVIAAAVIAAVIPELQENRVFGWDVHFHAARIMNIADGLSAGQFPVRVGGFSYNGYGAATSVFYPDLLLYPFALMVLSGASITYVIHVLCIAVSLFSGMTAYFAAKRLFKDDTAAACTAILYILSVYRLEDMYERLMVGEMLAMVFVPVFFIGLYEVIFGERRRWPLLAAGATLIFQSHMCTTLLCACLAAAACVLFAARLMREKGRIGALALAAVCTLLINIGTLLPFVMFYAFGVTTPTMQYGFEESALSVAQLMRPDGPIGLAMWIALLASLLVIGEEKDAEVRFAARLFAALCCIAALMTTKLFPWSYAVKLTGGLAEVIQFPWRLLVLAVPAFALCGGYGIGRLAGGRHRQAMLVTLALAVAAYMPYLDHTMNKKVGIEFGQGAKIYMVYPEYQYPGTDVNDTRSRDVIIEGGVQLEAYHKDGTQVTAQVTAETDGALTLPMFGFDGYEATINGEKAEWSRGENNRLRVQIPAGTQGELEIGYRGRTVWRIADAASCLSLAAFAAYCLRKRAVKKACR